MVQYTNLVIASAILASAGPAIAAPFDGRAQEDIEAREPMFNALKNIVTNPASRKVIISDPLKKIGKDGFDSHEAAERNKAHTGPTPAQKAWQNVKANQDKKSRRDLFDFEYDLD